MRRLIQRAFRGSAIAPLALTLFVGVPAYGQVALPGESCQVEAHTTWSDVEKWVWGRVCVGLDANLEVYDGRELDPAVDEGWDEQRLLTPRFLESMLLHDPWKSAIHRRGVRIIGALFDAPIDLVEGHIRHELWLDRSRFLTRVELHRTVTRSLVSFSGSVFLEQLSMAAASIGGTLYMNNGAQFADVVLRSTYVKGQLNMTDAIVSGELNMSLTTIGRGLFMKGSKFAEMTLRSIDVTGPLEMVGANVTGKLGMEASKIDGNLILRDRAEFADVSLRSVEVKDNVDMKSANVTGTLNVSGATIGASMFLRDGKFDNINGVFVRIGQNLDLRGAELSNLDLTGAHIEEELRLASPDSEPTWQDGARLVLRNTTANALVDTEGAWPAQLDLDGFQYQRLGGLGGNLDIADRGSEWYTGWLAQDEPYTPQPYEQLASVLRRMGHGEEANDVLYAGRERARAFTLADGHPWSWLGQTALKWTIGYGLGGRQFLSLIWVLVLLAIGTVWLRFSGQYRVKDQDRNEMKIGVFYSLDMLLPIISLRKRHYDIDLEGSVRYYFYFHQIMGYVLASFLIAGLSGLTT